MAERQRRINRERERREGGEGKRNMYRSHRTLICSNRDFGFRE